MIEYGALQEDDMIMECDLAIAVEFTDDIGTRMLFENCDELLRRLDGVNGRELAVYA